MRRPLILASTSDSRRVLLSRLHISFSVAAPDTDETPIKSEPPDARALRLAEEKAQSANAPKDALVLGAATKRYPETGEFLTSPKSAPAPLNN